MYKTKYEKIELISCEHILLAIKDILDLKEKNDLIYSE